MNFKFLILWMHILKHKHKVKKERPIFQLRMGDIYIWNIFNILASFMRLYRDHRVQNSGVKFQAVGMKFSNSLLMHSHSRKITPLSIQKTLLGACTFFLQEEPREENLRERKKRRVHVSFQCLARRLKPGRQPVGHFGEVMCDNRL